MNFKELYNKLLMKKKKKLAGETKKERNNRLHYGRVL